MKLDFLAEVWKIILWLTAKRWFNDTFSCARRPDSCRLQSTRTDRTRKDPREYECACDVPDSPSVINWNKKGNVRQLLVLKLSSSRAEKKWKMNTTRNEGMNQQQIKEKILLVGFPLDWNLILKLCWKAHRTPQMSHWKRFTPVWMFLCLSIQDDLLFCTVSTYFAHVR